MKIDGERLIWVVVEKWMNRCEWYRNFFLFPPLSHSLVRSFFTFATPSTTTWFRHNIESSCFSSSLSMYWMRSHMNCYEWIKINMGTKIMTQSTLLVWSSHSRWVYLHFLFFRFFCSRSAKVMTLHEFMLNLLQNIVIDFIFLKLIVSQMNGCEWQRKFWACCKWI